MPYLVTANPVTSHLRVSSTCTELELNTPPIKAVAVVEEPTGIEAGDCSKQLLSGVLCWLMSALVAWVWDQWVSLKK